MNVSNQIREFIHQNFIYLEPGNGLSDEQSFLDSGIVDSTGVLELVSFVEDTFEISIEDDELVPDNLDSVEKLNSFIKRKKKIKC